MRVSIHLSGERGFSMIEVLVALLIIGVGFMRLGKLLSGNGAVKGAVKDGMLGILGRMFRK